MKYFTLLAISLITINCGSLLDKNEKNVKRGDFGQSEEISRKVNSFFDSEVQSLKDELDLTEEDEDIIERAKYGVLSSTASWSTEVVNESELAEYLELVTKRKNQRAITNDKYERINDVILIFYQLKSICKLPKSQLTEVFEKLESIFGDYSSCQEMECLDTYSDKLIEAFRSYDRS